MTTNTYQEHARARKVAALVRVLDDIVTLPSHVEIVAECFAEAEWTMAARAAGVRMPSPTTRRMVVDILRLRHLPGDDEAEPTDSDVLALLALKRPEPLTNDLAEAIELGLPDAPTPAEYRGMPADPFAGLDDECGWSS